MLAGMSEVTVMFTLPSEALEALKAKASRDGTAPGAVLRNALRRELRTNEARQRARGFDPAFIGALRTLLARDIVEAQSWQELEKRLGTRGYELRLADDRLSLFGRDSKECLVDATEIGASYGALMRRFDGPMPDRKTGTG